jgi:hypothetical protein
MDVMDFGCRFWRPQDSGAPRRITRMTSSSLSIVAEAVCSLWKTRIDRIMLLRAP